MKNVIIISVIILFEIDVAYNQDILLYSKSNFQGERYILNIGDELVFKDGFENISFTINSSRAGLYVESIDVVKTQVENWQGYYSKLFFYSEEMSRNSIIGTDQYKNIPLRVKCVNKFIPEPDAFIPINKEKIHPESLPVINFKLNKYDKYLYVKRAFIYENAEDLRCSSPSSPHGPAGDIKISIVDNKNIQCNSLEVLNNYHHLWDINKDCNVKIVKSKYDPLDILYDCDSRFLQYRKDKFIEYFNIDSNDIGKEIYLPRTNYISSTLFGPYYLSSPACGTDFVFGEKHAPEAHNEWIDGPRGVYYSNFVLWDWNLLGLDSVGIIVTEADKPFDYVLVSSNNLADVIGKGVISKDDTDPIFISLGMSGWVILQNMTPEQDKSVDNTPFYWFPTMVEEYPELILGPKGDYKHFERTKHSYEEFSGINPHNIENRLRLSKVLRVYIDTYEKDTFRLYKFDLFDFRNIESDTIVVSNNDKIRDSLIYRELFYFDTITPMDLFRVVGSQYNPFVSYSDLKYNIHNDSYVTLIGEEIRAECIMDKPMNIVPNDSEYSIFLNMKNEYNKFNITNNYFEEYDNDIKLLAKGISINVFPNPFNNEFYLDCGDCIDEFDLQVYDGYGNVLRIYDNVRNRTRIDMSNYLSGIYFLKYISATQKNTFKVIKIIKIN